TASAVSADGLQLWVHTTQRWPALNLRVWKGRILDAVADRCVRQSRRDPRDSAVAEQSLYQQRDDALDRIRHGKFGELLLQTNHRYANPVLRREEFTGFCERLVLQSIDQLRSLLAGATTADAPRLVCLTHRAARLPGLTPALDTFMQAPPETAAPVPSAD